MNTEVKNKFNIEYAKVAKLYIYYYSLEITGIIFPLLVAITAYFFPKYYYWVESVNALIISTLIVGLSHFIFLFTEQFYNKGIFLFLRRYIYVVFFIFFIYISGRVDSPYIFLLFFPLLASATYLSKKSTKNVGIVITTGLALMIFTYPHDSLTPQFITRYISEVALFGTIAFLMHRLVVEILVQKYEKDHASERITEIIELDRLKEDFLSMAQHQLRTPLTGVKWVFETLKSDETISKDTMEIIDSGLSGVLDSISIVNKMLKTVEGKNEAITLKKQNTDIIEIIKIIIKELNFVILKKVVKVTFNGPESLFMQLDKDKIKATITNIIDNAIKYSPNGKVDISVVQDEKTVKLTIKDTGIGISTDDLPYVFERLHRGKNAILIEPDESGVGLYVSKKIIKLHGGNMSIVSEINKGTAVTVILPLN